MYQRQIFKKNYKKKNKSHKLSSQIVSDKFNPY